MLKASYKTSEEIPEDLKQYYEEKNGVWKLNVEGLVEKNRLDEFRDNNKKLMAQLDEASKNKQDIESRLEALNAEIQDKYGNVDLEAYNQYLAEQKAIEERKLIEAGKHEELLKRREDELRNTFAEAQREFTSKWEEKENHYKEALNKSNSQLNKLLIENQLSSLAAAHGVRATALEDVMYRGRATWQLQDGQAVAFDKNGNRLFESDQTTPLSMDSWMESLVESAPHLFEVSTGSGEEVSRSVTQDVPNRNSSNNNSDDNRHKSAIDRISEGLSGLK